MRNLLIVCAAAGSVALLNGCATSGALSKGDKPFARGQYDAAIPLYKADVAKSKNAGLLNFRIGESYRLSNRIEQAEPFYKAALDGQVKNADLGYRYAEALRASGKYDEAAAQFTAYAGSGANRTLAGRAENDSKNAAASKAIAGIKNRYEIMPVDALNTAASDYSGARMGTDGEFVFASGREGTKYLGNGEAFTDLFAIKFDNTETMTGGTPRKLEGPFNTATKHEASATFTPDGKVMVFARSNSGKKNDYRSPDGVKTTLLSVDLYISFNKGGTWSEPILANINDRSADDFAPAFSPDGTTLYFASGRKGGQGGTDLYRATLGGNGRFSPAENLGESVNSAGNETFPGVAADGTLYFASDGRPGLGKLDLFMQAKGGQATNLGADVNSTADDFAPVPVGKDMGLFSSNREGGKGSDDFYMFKKKPFKKAIFAVSGTVLEVVGTAAPVPSSGAQVSLTLERQAVQGPATTDAAGKFTFRADSTVTYRVVAEKPGYFSATQRVSIPSPPSQAQLPNVINNIDVPVTLTLTKIIKNKAIEVKDILYDYNKYDIRPDAAIRLDTLVQTLVDNPKISIELSSHTDQRGKDAYNLKLSQQRAQAAVDYIVSKGIDKARITAKGYGETKPIVVKPTSEAEYQRNRRTEFKVTRVAQ